MKELIQNDSQESVVVRHHPTAEPRVGRQFDANQLEAAVLKFVTVDGVSMILGTLINSNRTLITWWHFSLVFISED